MSQRADDEREQALAASERRAQTATDALAQMIATTEELHRRLVAADAEAELARDALRDAMATDGHIAGALHDTAGQSLTAANRFLDAARASIARSDADAALRHLDDAQASVVAAIREVRAVVDVLSATGDGPHRAAG
jgi:signal transduction histidine kinase